MHYLGPAERVVLETVLERGVDHDEDAAVCTRRGVSFGDEAEILAREVSDSESQVEREREREIRACQLSRCVSLSPFLMCVCIAQKSLDHTPRVEEGQR